MRRDPTHGISPCGGSGQLATLSAVSDRRAAGSVPRDSGQIEVAASARRLWRIFGTGISFVVFGALALGLTVLVFPLCTLASRDADRRQARVQRVIHHAYRFFLKLMEGLGLFRTEWSGAAALRTPGPHLIVANHPTLIDVIQLISHLPQADCVISMSHARNPFLARAASQAGYITNADGAAVVGACVEKLRAGRTVVLFPEGTRSSSIGMQPFRRGAAHIALRAGVPILPIAIACVPGMLRKGQPWWDVPQRQSQFTIAVLSPIAPSSNGASSALEARHLTATLREQIVEGLARAVPH